MNEAQQLQTKLHHFIWKLRGLMLIPFLASCSLVQYLPSSSCDYVKYERNGDQVEAYARCKV